MTEMNATYTIDPSHTAAQFSVRHMMVSTVRGEFTKVSGTIVYDAANPGASRVEALIEADSLYTREPQRDAHLKSPDFFDVAKYPSLSFKSNRVEKSASGLRATGELTMHGITREVTLDIDGPTAEAKDPWGNLRIGACAKTKINRKDWGLTWNQALEFGGVLIGDEVTITIDVEGIKTAPEQK